MSALTSAIYINLLVQHEMTISALYTVFGRKLPGMATFWTEISTEEKAHAMVLRELEVLLEQKRVVFVPPGAKIAIIEESLEWMTNLIRETNHSDSLSPGHCLNFALKLEMSMIEKNFFDLFAGGDPDMIREFNALIAHTQEHIHRITAEMKHHHLPPDPA